MDKLNYCILNLEPGADMEEVRHRYDMLMKRSLRDDSMDMDAINGAYDSIMAEKTVDYFNPDGDLIHEKGINKKKILNFLYQNRLRIGVILWIILSLLILILIMNYFRPGNTPLFNDTLPY